MKLRFSLPTPKPCLYCHSPVPADRPKSDYCKDECAKDMRAHRVKIAKKKP